MQDVYTFLSGQLRVWGLCRSVPDLKLWDLYTFDIIVCSVRRARKVVMSCISKTLKRAPG